MPVPSPYPDFELPNVDLWDFIFRDHGSGERVFPRDTVIYQQTNDNRRHTFLGVRDGASQFGEALMQKWSWRKGAVLALLAPNDVDYGIVVYGTLYAGGVILPANPDYSASEFAHMLRDAGVDGVVTHESTLPVAREAMALAGIPLDRLLLLGPQGDTDASLPLHFSKFAQQATGARRGKQALDPDKDLAFLAYSSGTTGLPKGVMLSHRNLVADILMVRHAVGHNYRWENDRILGVLPFYHIYGLTGLLHQSLHRGIKMLVMPKFELEDFCHAIQTHKITLTYVAPPVLVKLSRSESVKSYDLSSLRMITCGAAPLTKELVTTIHSKLGLKVNQAYGLSETSPMTHTQPWEDWLNTVGSIGRLFPNMTAKYMTADGVEAQPGQPGELWLRGPNVFKGYWKREEATKESITTDGFFKTGDVGYQDENHNCYISDRVKELIKWNGFQVPPAELEGLLLDCPMVSDVAVIGVYLPKEHTEAPRAYVVCAAGTQPSEETGRSIQEWLKKRVVYYKFLRGGVRFIDAIPKSASGKILRRVLKDVATSEDTAALKAKL